jgi:uncharacterized repeat protein (TIGR01451 family)
VRGLLRAGTLAVVTLALAGGVSLGATATFGPLERIPTPPAGTNEVDLNSFDAVIRGPAGRYVAFVDAVESDVPARRVFVRDRVAGITEGVTATDAGADPSGLAGGPDISDDGRFVVFVAPVPNLGQAVFVRDRQAGRTARLTPDGEYAFNSNPDITPDGRYVVWIAGAAGDYCVKKLVLYDRTSSAATVLRQADRCGPAHQPDITEICCRATVSDDGRYVAFDTPLCVRVAGTCSFQDLQVFVHDRLTGTLEQASVNSAGQPGKGGATAPARGTNWLSRISGDGRYVTWVSIDPNLAPVDAVGYDTFVRDLQADTTEVVSVDSSGNALGGGNILAPELSTNGRFVVSGYRNADGRNNAYVRDRLERTTTILNDAGDAARQIIPGAAGPSISGDGACVVMRAATFVGPNAELRAFVTCANTPSSELRVAHAADAATVRAGNMLGFTLTVTNTGAATATGVQMDNALPGDDGIEWSIASHSGTPPCDIQGETGDQRLTCGPAYLSAGSTMKVHVTSPTTKASCGSYKSTADYWTANSGSGSASASARVDCTAAGDGAGGPEPRKTAVLRRKSGRVLVRLQGRRAFSALSGTMVLPLGSEVDATRGTVTVTVATTRTRVESADVAQGRFVVRQPSAVAVLSVSGSCAKTARRLRTVAGSHFQTRGRFSAATGAAKGSVWIVSDRCGATRTDVKRGRVRVVDFTTGRVVRLRAGKAYVAEP